jgi:uncharacterized protein YdeI (YjbR/CyaY-like superfamily)
VREAPPAARRHWEGFARSARKGILGWIALARRPETRSARIARTVEMAARNRRAQLDG